MSPVINSANSFFRVKQTVTMCFLGYAQMHYQTKILQKKLDTNC